MIAKVKATIKAVNEDSYLICFADKIDLGLTAIISSLNTSIKNTLAEHLLDSTPSYTTILVQFNLLTTSPLVVLKQLEVLVDNLNSSISADKKRHRLPVYYDASVAPDLQELAKAKGLTVAEVIKIHSEQVYQVCALGFSPGFAFLAEVDERIQMPRLATPRSKVNAGSVAIADKQTAVYPSDSPGGWNIIGHCPVPLFDMNKQPISEFSVGDEVEFYAVDETHYVRLMEQYWGEGSQKPTSCLAPTSSDSYLEVLNPGMLTQIQDAGRFGQSEQGVSQGGYADNKSAGWANRLLGNDFNAPLLEITVGGLELRASVDVQLALTGADMQALIFNGQKQQVDSVQQQSFILKAGHSLKLAYSKSGLRAYLALKGGFVMTKSLGSCSTVSRNRIGGLNRDGKNLKQGDRLVIPSQQLSESYISHKVPALYAVKTQQITRIALIESYQAHLFTPQQKQFFYNNIYTVSNENDRMGMRLQGPALELKSKGIVSEGIALGSVQIPADGVPIILLQDRQTLGGYPKIGCITRHDLSLLAQLSAGAKIQFYPLSINTAQQQCRELLQFFQGTKEN